MSSGKDTVAGAGLERKLREGTAVFGVVGLGYVGLPLAVEMAKAGNRAIGFEVLQNRADEVNAGRSYIADVPSAELSPLVDAGLIQATCDFSRAAECDCIAICVPTPLDAMKEPDVSYMVAATESIAPHLSPDTLVTLESTTYPGTTEEVLLPLLQAGGTENTAAQGALPLRVGENLFLAFSPERVDPGNTTWQTKNTPKVVGGVTPRCTELARLFYERFLEQIVPVSSTRAAEMSKLLENIFRCVNIALVNELLQLCERMQIDLWEVIDAAKTKPFGFMPFYPGPGLGGHCIPLDPFYLSWKAREFDFRTEFIELSGRVNENMPYYVVDRVMSALNTQGKALRGARVLVLGVAYKPDIDDMRESPAIKVITLLKQKDPVIVFHDPYVSRYIQDGESVEPVALTADEVRAADVVLVLTAHSNVDYAMVAREAKLVLDTRNVFAPDAGAHIIKL
ncbi:MAG: nucleotide sugar dehydrogenase [Actinomycetes bacterium]|jgi:UDP-N-acetyl-D-glucosamine dehydrogenase|nr:nucleotide sugar dehydrogenase [Actinomycetes bacterium]